MTLDWWTLGLQTINLIVLIWLLSKFLFKPVARIIAERQALAGQMLDEAAAERDSAQQARAQAEAFSRQLEAERASTLKKAQQEATEARRQLLQGAEHEAAQLRRQAEQAITQAEQIARRAAEAHATALALDIAARLLARLPAEAQVLGFIDGLCQGVRSLPEPVRQALAAERGPLRLLSARALDENERQRCHDALAEVLGQAPSLAVQVEPALIAGLELEAGSAEVRNSFRADLARLAEEFAREPG